ncbi:MAG: lipocalin family protein [Pseudomonadota bacterium]
MKRTSFLALAAGLAVAGAALAAAPQPSRPVDAGFYSGRWYEIARIPNAGQRDCQAPVTQFTRVGGAGDVAFVSDTGEFRVRQVCRRGSPAGPERVFNTRGRILPGAANAKFEMTFLGGLKTQEYWVLDCASDHSWAIMATPGGNYVWLLSRQPRLDPAAQARLVARVRALGYRQRLEFPAQTG